MYNQVYLVGRLAAKPIFMDKSADALIHIKIPRPFCENGNKRNYDLIPVVLWKGMAEMVDDTCHVGSFLSIKGRIMNRNEKRPMTDMEPIYVKGESVELLDHIFEQEYNHKN